MGLIKPCVLDRDLQKLQQKYTDTRVSTNVSQLNVALQDVQRIMVQNIDDVLKRGEALTGKFSMCEKWPVLN